MTASTSPTHAPDSFPVQMYNLLNGHFLVQALYAAAMLRIADLLADGPKSAEELAQASSSHGPSLHRLLRMLASVGVFAKDEAGALC